MGLAYEFLKWNSIKTLNSDAKQPIEDWLSMVHLVQVDAGDYEDGFAAMRCVIKDRNEGNCHGCMQEGGI